MKQLHFAQYLMLVVYEIGFMYQENNSDAYDVWELFHKFGIWIKVRISLYFGKVVAKYFISNIY